MEKAIEREINGASCSSEQFLFDRSSTPISADETRESVEYTLFKLFSDDGPTSGSSSSSVCSSLSLSSFASDSFTFSTISTTETSTSTSSSSEEYEEPTLTCTMCQYMPIKPEDIPTECIDYLIRKYFRLTKNSEESDSTHLKSEEKQPNGNMDNISFNIPYVSSDSDDSRDIFEGDEFYTHSPIKQCFGPIGC